MKIKEIISIVVLLVFFSCDSTEQKLMHAIETGFAVSELQSINMAEALLAKTDSLPKTFSSNGQLILSDSHWWCSGFFPGVLWYLYEENGDSVFRKYAEYYTSRVEKEKFTTDNHDVGFILSSSFGNGFRLTGNKAYRDVLLTGAESLATRFNSRIGLIRSWDNNKNIWQYPVIIDNMMNLELIMWASKYTSGTGLKDIAISHADLTMKNHFRPDGSSYHVVSYDTISTYPQIKQTWQGFGDESSWARGQAWGLYGYTMMYRETRLQRYLDQAVKIANYILYHPNLPDDKIPYWDFDDIKIPDVPRDASAASIMASAFIELSDYVDEELAKKCLETAKTQLIRLSSPDYLAKPGTNGNFILKHGVGFLPRNQEVDVPLTYADYYYVEALIRMKKKISKTT